MKINQFSKNVGRQFTLLIVSCLCAFNVAANGSIGAMFGFGSSEYKDYDPDPLPLPMINYEDDLFYFHAVSGGIFLDKSDYSSVTLGLSYFPKEFDASDSTDPQLQQLDDRDSTGMVDLGYRYNHPYLGSVSALVSVDFLDKTDGGWKMDLGYKKNLKLNERLSVTPGFGVTWFNEDLNEHYYGINAAESVRSGLNQYHPDSSSSTYAELSANYFLSNTVSLFANGRYVWLDSEVTDSPMVDSDHYVGAMFGINMLF